MKHIGIVAVSTEGAALCYRTICLEGAALLGVNAHPEISLHNFPLASYQDLIDRDDWRRVGELLLESAAKLVRAGAELLICPDNTVHQGLDLVRERSSVAWLHIAEQVADEAKRQGFKCVGILGTRFLTEGPVYPSKLGLVGIAHRLPIARQRTRINEIIYDELVHARFLPSSLAYFQDVIRDLKKDGCDAVALACTEIPLLVDQADSELPILDSTRIPWPVLPFARQSPKRQPFDAIWRHAMIEEQALIRVTQAATPSEIEAVRVLFREYAAFLASDPARPFAAADLSSQNFAEELVRLPGNYAPPEGRLLLALSGEKPAGCVALHRFADRTCEMKRMWVRPEFRGSRLGRQLAEKVVAEAEAIGYERMLLDTLPSLESALRLYRALGFLEVAPYRNAPDSNSVFMELKLAGR